MMRLEIYIVVYSNVPLLLMQLEAFGCLTSAKVLSVALNEFKRTQFSSSTRYDPQQHVIGALRLSTWFCLACVSDLTALAVCAHLFMRMQNRNIAPPPQSNGRGEQQQ
jgi:hypothetical protein